MLTNCNCSICRRYGVLWANWKRIRARKPNYMGVNARNFEPAALESVRIRLLDGADTWKYLD